MMNLGRYSLIEGFWKIRVHTTLARCQFLTLSSSLGLGGLGTLIQGKWPSASAMADLSAMADMTVEELRAEIAATRQRQAAEADRTNQIEADIEEAIERQRLRRELEAETDVLSDQQLHNQNRIGFLNRVNADIGGPRLSVARLPPPPTSKPQLPQLLSASSVKQRTSFGHEVARGEYVDASGALVAPNRASPGEPLDSEVSDFRRGWLQLPICLQPSRRLS